MICAAIKSAPCSRVLMAYCPRAYYGWWVVCWYCSLLPLRFERMMAREEESFDQNVEAAGYVYNEGAKSLLRISSLWSSIHVMNMIVSPNYTSALTTTAEWLESISLASPEEAWHIVEILHNITSKFTKTFTWCPMCQLLYGSFFLKGMLHKFF